MKKIIVFIYISIISSCAIGYQKLTEQKLEKMEDRGKVELIHFNNLPLEVSDTLIKEYKIYYEKNTGKKNMVYSMNSFISLDSLIRGEHIKYQDFNSNKLRLPFGYFFRFGSRKFFVPYYERKISNTFIYSEGYMFFYGKYLGSPKETNFKVGNPDQYKIDYKNRAYWKMKL